MKYFSISLSMAAWDHNTQKEETLITTATGLYFLGHLPEGSPCRAIIRANHADLQGHHCPLSSNTRVTQGVTTLENHHDRAGCPLRTKSCNALVRQSDYNQEKQNDGMLDEQNYGGKEYSEERKDQHGPCMENMEIPHTQPQHRLYNATATLTADPLHKTGSSQESEQPCGNTQEGETGAMKTWFALKETNQHQPMVYGEHSKSITGNKGAPLIVFLLLHLFTLYEHMTAHHFPDPFTPQQRLQSPQFGYSPCETNSGKNPTAWSYAHHATALEISERLREQVLDGKVHGEKAYNGLISTLTGPIPPTCVPHMLTITTLPITAMTHSYTYKEQALRILQLHDWWNTHIMWWIDVICNAFPKDLSKLYKLYGLLIWPYTIKEIISELWGPLIVFVNSPEAIPTLAEWQPQPEAPSPWAANTGNWGAAWGEGMEPW
jgi:hypothetical protein